MVYPTRKGDGSTTLRLRECQTHGQVYYRDKSAAVNISHVVMHELVHAEHPWKPTNEELEVFAAGK